MIRGWRFDERNGERSTDEEAYMKGRMRIQRREKMP